MILYFMQDCLEKSRKKKKKTTQQRCEKGTGTLHSPGAEEAGKECQEFMRKLQQMARAGEEDEWVKGCSQIL